MDLGHELVVDLFAGGGGASTGIDARRPAGTVTTQDHHALCAAHLLNLKGRDRRHRPLDTPAPTITAGGNHAALVAALMAPYYGSGSGTTGRDLRDPAPTVTARDRLQLVTVIIDQGPDGRRLSKAAQVRGCGNSVCPPLAQALVAANFAHEAAWTQDEVA
ncbi:hypothetical protein DFQ59_102462 [Thioalbus denitrificans]|uniref:DNA (cytosine-5-)-methyltransferase n=2 Tax=Thioalbus denitrificans TaxID=547122 RepID=A0A369CDX4_9GAMM|nr:hypothetical protein DFQ59_102462 [Thioalbus denitrificans]